MSKRREQPKYKAKRREAQRKRERRQARETTQRERIASRILGSAVDLANYLPPLEFVPLPEAARAPVAANVDALLSRLSPQVSEERLIEARARFDRFLLSQTCPRRGQILAVEAMEYMTNLGRTVVYWREIDELIYDTQYAALELFRRAMTAALSAINDTVVSGTLQRQAIEAAVWIGFFQYGATVAFSSFARALHDQSGVYIMSKDIDDYARGAYAEDPKRVAAAWKAVGKAGDNPQFGDNWVESTTATFRKQGSVLKWIAANIDRPTLAPALQTIGSAYGFLCGYVHVTPLSLGVAGKIEGETEVNLPDPDRLLLEVFMGCTTLLEDYVLWLDRSRHKFLPVALSVAPKPNGSAEPTMIQLDVSLLRDLRSRDNDVKTTTSDGELITIYSR